MQLVGELESRVRPGDLLFLLLLGHGNFDGSDYRYNLRGPDLTGEELSAILDRFPAQRIVLVCTTPASGALIPRLSRGNRVILTATKNGHEGNETVFARFFVESLHNPEADTDKSGQVSLLEAYSFTHRRVKGVVHREKPAGDRTSPPGRQRRRRRDGPAGCRKRRGPTGRPGHSGEADRDRFSIRVRANPG